MSLLLTLAMLKRGEQINDELLRSTLRRPPHVEAMHQARVKQLLRIVKASQRQASAA